MANFHELINRNTPTLVDFYAHWCQPCKMVSPILEKAKTKLGDTAHILKVDVDRNNKAAQKYNIRSIPTLILFKNGKIMWRKTGVPSLQEILEEIRKVS